MDITTIYLVQGGLLVVSTVALFINWRLNETIEEAKYWFFSLGTAVFGAFLFGLFAQMPDQAVPWVRLIITIGNLVYAYSAILLYSGACCVLKRPLPSWRATLFILALIALALILIDQLTTERHIWRAAASASTLGFINGTTAILLLLSSRSMFSLKRVAGVFIGIMALALAVRATLLVLTGLGGEYPETLVLTGPIYVSTLMITGFTISFILLTVRSLHLRLVELANTDPLTGVLNRRAFYDIAPPLAASMIRNRHCVGIAVVDLDHFKKINDRYGHAAGDEMLKHFTTVVTQALRKGDVFARFGGEEFVILLTGDTKSKIIQAAERIRTIFADSSITTNGETIKATASFGLSFMPADDDNLEKILNAADRALYEAKQTGRNKVVCFEATFSPHLECSPAKTKAPTEIREGFTENGAVNRT